MKTEFSVIIVTWNRKANLTKAVDSILKQQGISFQLIIIDNGSSDGTSEYGKMLSANNKNCIYYGYNFNIGITRAMNKGFSLASGEIIFCFDDDQIISDDHLLEKVVLLSKTKKWNILNIGVRNYYTRKWEHFIYSYPVKRYLNKSFYVNNFGNGSVFIKKEVLDRIGFFENCYFREVQENEYALRAMLNGFYILYYPELVIEHKVDPNRPSQKIVFYYSLRNTLLKNYKYFTGYRLLVLNCWQLFHFFLRLCKGRITIPLYRKAIKEYFSLRKKIDRYIYYHEERIKKYFFVSRKAVNDSSKIGCISFAEYCFMALVHICMNKLYK